MKKIYLILLYTISFLLMGCQEKEWPTNNLVLTPVLEVTIDPSIPNILYIYTKKNIMIQNDIEEFILSDLKEDINDPDLYKISFKTESYDKDLRTYKVYYIEYNNDKGKGIIKIDEYNKDSNEIIPENHYEHAVTSIKREDKLIDK